MSESQSHRRAKRKAAGNTGATECLLPSGELLDACSPGRVTEVERSGSFSRLLHSAEKLAQSRVNQKVLQVPDHHMDVAVAAMRESCVSGTVKNMSGSRRRWVPPCGGGATRGRPR